MCEGNERSSDISSRRSTGDKPAAGRLVFAGHGLAASGLKIDDFAGLDVSGAIVLVLDEVPDAVKRMPSISSEERAELGSVERKSADARARGAVGLIIERSYLGDPHAMWPQTTSVRSAQ